MRSGYIIFAVFPGVLAGCASSDENSFRGHLAEAISLNEARRSRYAELARDDRPALDLSQESKAVSDLLIRAEKTIVLASHLPTWFCKGVNFDKAARVFQQAGIPIIREDFVSMEEVPDIQLYRRPFPVPGDQYPIRFDLNNQAITDFASAANAFAQEIERLSDEPRLNCMLRHVLESARRIANHAPIYIDLAAREGLSSPEKLLWRMLRSHFWLLDDEMQIDRLSAPLHARGIPIICNDVPPIPPYSETLMQLIEEVRKLR